MTAKLRHVIGFNIELLTYPVFFFLSRHTYINQYISLSIYRPNLMHLSSDYSENNSLFLNPQEGIIHKLGGLFSFFFLLATNNKYNYFASAWCTATFWNPLKISTDNTFMPTVDTMWNLKGVASEWKSFILFKKKKKKQRKRRQPTFFDLVVHWEGVVGLHVGGYQDLAGIFQHLRGQRGWGTREGKGLVDTKTSFRDISKIFSHDDCLHKTAET